MNKWHWDQNHHCGKIETLTDQTGGCLNSLNSSAMTQLEEEEIMLNFIKIIPEIRPIETLDWFCLTEQKIYLWGQISLLMPHKIHIWEAMVFALYCGSTAVKLLLRTSDRPVWNPKTFLVQYNSCDVKMCKRRSWSLQGYPSEERTAGLKLAMSVRRPQFHPVTIKFSVFMSPRQTCHQTKTLLLLQRLHFNVLHSSDLALTSVVSMVPLPFM